MLTDQDYLREVANQLRTHPRQGEVIDEPEGIRYIMMSHTLALRIAEMLDGIAERMEMEG